MKKYTKKNKRVQQTSINYDFEGTTITSYGGLLIVRNFLQKCGLLNLLAESLEGRKCNALKFTNLQIILLVLFGKVSNIGRILHLENFSHDCLVQKLLQLPGFISDQVISFRLKKLGSNGVGSLTHVLHRTASQTLIQQRTKELTIDCDSTVNTVFGNQEKANKGYNPKYRGFKSYHPLIAFSEEHKLVLNTEFRSGDAFTSQGICEFTDRIAQNLPCSVKTVTFRADSGFFDGELFDKLEKLGWQYLVKVRRKNLNGWLKDRDWKQNPKDSNYAYCEFNYQAKGWGKPRKIIAVRKFERILETEIFGVVIGAEKEYSYFAYCTNMELSGKEAVLYYSQRATSENWIEQVKNQLCGATTLTSQFEANAILWIISALAYNISVMMRIGNEYFFRQEHKTFREWFIKVPGLLIIKNKRLLLRIDKHYYFKERWLALAERSA